MFAIVLKMLCVYCEPLAVHFLEVFLCSFRLESTLESDEKELYKMQRSNSGSLFPTSFYAAKKQRQPEQPEENVVSVDGGGELGTDSVDPRQRFMHRSHSENEFRNLARISESEPHESSDEHKSPTVSVSSRSAVEYGQHVFGGDNVFEGDAIKRRSYSDNNLNKHAFQDELQTRLTMDGATNGRPPTVFAEDASSLKEKMKPENAEEDMLKLKIDSSPEKEPCDPFKGKELQTFMTVPSKKSGVSSQLDSKPSLGVHIQQNGKPSSGVSAYPDKKPPSGVTTRPFDKSVDSSGKLDKMNGNLSSFGEEEQIPEAQSVYNNNEVISKFNNNYKQVSEILTSDEQKNTEITQDEPTSPVRPPRKKDKKLKKSLRVEADEPNIYDSEMGQTSTYTNSKDSIDGISSADLTDNGLGSTADYDKSKVSDPTDNWQAGVKLNSRSPYMGNEMYLEQRSQSSNSPNDYRMQSGPIYNTDLDYKNRDSKGRINQQGDVDQDYTREYKNQDYTRSKSAGFAIHKAYSDENVFEQYSKLNARRKSEGFTRGARDSTSYEELRKPDYTRPKSGGFTDWQRIEGLRDELKHAGWTGQREVSLDHPRRRSHEEAVKRVSELAGSEPEGFVDQQRSASFADRRRADGFASQTDQPRRRTMHSLPSQTNQSESRHVLPEVLLDTSRRRASAGYTGGPQDDPRPSRNDIGSNTQVERRVPPPYRPPLGLASEQGPYLEKGNRRRSLTRPSYAPPPPPVAKEPPPYRQSLEFTPPYSSSNPESRTGYPAHSSGSLSTNTRSVSQPSYPPPYDVTPIAPPRKHRGSVSSEDTVYPPAEISPTAPPRKHPGSVPSTEDLYRPPDEVSPTAPPRKHRNNSRSEDYPPTGLSPTPSPQKHRASVPSSTEYFPITTYRPSYPPPSLPSNIPPASHPISQRGEDHTFERDVSFDPPKRRSQNYEPDVITARSYDPTEYSTQSSNYQRSEPKGYFSSNQGNFEGQSSHYRRSEPSEYNLTGYGNFQQQSSNYRRSDGNEYNRSDSDYPQTSSLQYPSDSSRNYPSEFRSNFEPIAARDQVDGYESWSIRPRPAVDTTTRDQSPPDEVVVARSVTSEPERVTNYPDEFRNDRREPPEYIPMRKPPDMSVDGYDMDRRNGPFTQPSYENEFDSVIKPEYIGYEQTNSVIMPKYEGYIETNKSRPETNPSGPEQNFTEPEFIVAKQMSAHEVVSEAHPVARGSREDMNTLPGALAQEMKYKWASNSSDGSNESSESRNKYRMTSMI